MLMYGGGSPIGFGGKDRPRIASPGEVCTPQPDAAPGRASPALALLLLFVALFPLLAAACGGSDDPATPTATPDLRPAITITGADGKSVSVFVEYAATLEQRQVGLMNRDALAEDSGMLFIFAGDVQTGFWMKNTRIPLDIAHIGADGMVQEIFTREPFDETISRPSDPYRYVLEVDGGWFAERGLGVGSKVTFPADMPAGQ